MTLRVEIGKGYGFFVYLQKVKKHQMHTVKLRVNDGVYDKLIWLLSKFNKDEVEIIPETSDFTNNQRYLAGELNEILNGKAKFVEMDEAEQRLEDIIKKHEGSI